MTAASTGAADKPCLDPMEIAFPRIKWREPIELTLLLDDERKLRWGCRVCLAKTALLHKEVLQRCLYDSYAAAAEHIASHF